jgi:hypothetical protein
MDKDRRKIRAEQERVQGGEKVGNSGKFQLPSFLDGSLKINCKQRKYYMSSIKELAHF